jgi:hypothetical protein
MAMKAGNRSRRTVNKSLAVLQLVHAGLDPARAYRLPNEAVLCFQLGTD